MLDEPKVPAVWQLHPSVYFLIDSRMHSNFCVERSVAILKK